MISKPIRQESRATLKEIKSIANVLLEANKELKKKKKISWENEVIENNIYRLKQIIREVNRNLKEVNSSDDLEFEQSVNIAESKDSFSHHDMHKLLTKMYEPFLLLLEVHQYSPIYSIAYDLYWIMDGTGGEKFDVSLLRKPPDIYEKYCPDKIKIIQNEVIPYLYKKKNYTISCKLLEDVINGFTKNSFLTSNILLITITESIVRELAKNVYAKQNPHKSADEVYDYIYNKFLSLEQLIIKGDWKNDIPINIVKAYLLSKYVKDPGLDQTEGILEKNKSVNEKLKIKLSELEKLIAESTEDKNQQEKLITEQFKECNDLIKELINPMEHTINISLRIKLQFLLRRYKEDRNSIIHGNYSEFDKGWKCYIYLAAIIKVFEVIKLYDELPHS